MEVQQPVQAPPIIQKDFQTKIFEWSARNSKTLISLFWIPYILVLGVLAFGAHQSVTSGPYNFVMYDIGKKFGQAALLLLGVVVIPGMLGRFRIEIKATRVITLLRRQLGITVFLLAFTHFVLIRFLPGMTILPITTFQLMGLLALTILFLMFLTSNNMSVRNLGPWWKRLHRLVYVALWLLVLHVGLQRISVWTVTIFVFATLEVISLVYDFLKKKQAQTVAANSS